MTIEAENSSVTHAMDRQEDRWRLLRRSLPWSCMCLLTEVFACLYALTHSRGWEREIASVLLPASLCETESCPYRLSSPSMTDFRNKIRSNRPCN